MVSEPLPEEFIKREHLVIYIFGEVSLLILQAENVMGDSDQGAGNLLKMIIHLHKSIYSYNPYLMDSNDQPQCCASLI